MNPVQGGRAGQVQSLEDRLVILERERRLRGDPPFNRVGDLRSRVLEAAPARVSARRRATGAPSRTPAILMRSTLPDGRGERAPCSMRKL